MQQIVETLVGDEIRVLSLPDANEYVMPDIRWGKFDDLFTPAYWTSQAWFASHSRCTINHRLGNTLTEEVAVCILGGFGMSADLGLAAFERVRSAGMLENYAPSEESISALLSRPINLNGRQCKYRYPKQRSRYLATALNRLQVEVPPQTTDREFRKWLLTFPGIGPKTASWITRNWLNSNEVAILDIHILRAGMLLGIFSHNDDVGKSYFKMEKKFLDFASAIGVAASNLDDMMWQQMRKMNRLAIRTLNCIHPVSV